MNDLPSYFAFDYILYRVTVSYFILQKSVAQKKPIRKAINMIRVNQQGLEE